MLNSSLNLQEIEKQINQIERLTPLEIRVVFSSKRVKSAVGGVRLIIIALLLTGLLVDIFWIPFPAWVIYLLAIPVVFLPGSILAQIPLSHHFIVKKEKVPEVAERAREAYQKLHMGSTQAGNALLVLFCTAEHIFHILPDSRMAAHWPEENWYEYVALVEKILKDNVHEQDNGITAAVTVLLSRIEIQAIKTLGPRLESQKRNELDNKVVELDLL